MSIQTSASKFSQGGEIHQNELLLTSEYSSNDTEKLFKIFLFQTPPRNYSHFFPSKMTSLKIACEQVLVSV